MKTLKESLLGKDVEINKALNPKLISWPTFIHRGMLLSFRRSDAKERIDYLNEETGWILQGKRAPEEMESIMEEKEGFIEVMDILDGFRKIPILKKWIGDAPAASSERVELDYNPASPYTTQLFRLTVTRFDTDDEKILAALSKITRPGWTIQAKVEFPGHQVSVLFVKNE